jgi:uncharacterized protein (TIGR02145 family)
MSQNLDVSAFRNGDPIPEVESKEEWVKAGNDKKPAWCYYNGKDENGSNYGKLYNWYAVNDSRGLAPKGWHIPTDSEWTVLTNFLGSNAAKKMKSATEWENNGNGDNNSGFAAFPAGHRLATGEFYGIGQFCFFWSATDYITGSAWYRTLNYHDVSAGRDNNAEGFGFSVRCIRN